MIELMEKAITQIISSYTQYAGNSMYILLFFLSLLYIYATKDKRDNVVLLCYYSIITLFFIYNPLIAHFVIYFIQGLVYWRMFWILPIPVVISCAATLFIIKISGKCKKIIITIGLIVIMMAAGKFIFTSDNFETSSNWFKLPAQAVEICNILEDDTNEVIRVVVPADLEVSIRQYDADIQMVYGRDANVFTNELPRKSWDRADLRTLVNQPVINVEWVTQLLIEFDCNYLVVNVDTLLSDGFGKYGYHCIASTNNYNIYRFNSEEIS